MKIKPKGKLSDHGYMRFKELFFRKQWAPGQFISQSELVEITKVPLSPMREAFQKLASQRVSLMSYREEAFNWHR